MGERRRAKNDLSRKYSAKHCYVCCLGRNVNAVQLLSVEVKKWKSVARMRSRDMLSLKEYQI